MRTLPVRKGPPRQVKNFEARSARLETIIRIKEACNVEKGAYR